MAYDAHETRATLEPPALTIGRVENHLFRTVGRFAVWVRRQLNRIPGVEMETETKTYQGRLLSHREWLEFKGRFETVDPEDYEAFREIFRDYLLAIRIPPSVVFSLPGAQLMEAMEDFFACQLRAEGIVQSGAGELDLGAIRPANLTKTGS